MGLLRKCPVPIISDLKPGIDMDALNVVDPHE